MFDKNGNLRDIIKQATSITISSDQGKGKGSSKNCIDCFFVRKLKAFKGSMKSIVAFNAPGYRFGASEAILLSLLKAREEFQSLELLMESSWPLTIHNFAEQLNIPIFFTGIVVQSGFIL